MATKGLHFHVVKTHQKKKKFWKRDTLTTKYSKNSSKSPRKRSQEAKKVKGKKHEFLTFSGPLDTSKTASCLPKPQLCSIELQIAKKLTKRKERLMTRSKTDAGSSIAAISTSAIRHQINTLFRAPRCSRPKLLKKVKENNNLRILDLNEDTRGLSIPSTQKDYLKKPSRDSTALPSSIFYKKANNTKSQNLKKLRNQSSLGLSNPPINVKQMIRTVSAGLFQDFPGLKPPMSLLVDGGSFGAPSNDQGGLVSSGKSSMVDQSSKVNNLFQKKQKIFKKSVTETIEILADSAESRAVRNIQRNKSVSPSDFRRLRRSGDPNTPDTVGARLGDSLSSRRDISASPSSANTLSPFHKHRIGAKSSSNPKKRLNKGRTIETEGGPKNRALVGRERPRGILKNSFSVRAKPRSKSKSKSRQKVIFHQKKVILRYNPRGVVKAKLARRARSIAKDAGIL